MGSGVTGWRKHARAIGGVVAFTGLMSLLKLHEWVASRIEDLEQVEATERPVSWNDWSRNLIVDIISRLLAELKAVCDEDRVVVGVEERTFHAKPWHSHFAVKAIPDIVVYPKSQEEVVAVVNACAKYKVPMIPFAGGTSMEGQSMTPHKGVSINMKLMKRVKELHLEDMDVVVESGIGWIELNEFLKPHGLFFPLDPGPGASIGGMCATRCSGSLAVRYGTMRDNVISLKCILPNGDVVKTAARARKSAAGYDLTRLLIGSEGTLGLITEVTLRLQKIPEASVTGAVQVLFLLSWNRPESDSMIVAMCNFKSIGDATAVAIATMHSGIQVSRVELLDEMMMNAINIANGKNYPTEPTLMFEFVGTEAYALEQTSRVEKIVQAHNGSDFVYADSEMEKEELWKIRKGAFWSSFSLRPGAEGMTTDVCVPLSRLAECISTSKERLLASSLPHVLVAHAGDGNFHVCIFFDKNNEEEVKEALEIADGIVHLSLSMEGTCTGEHGVGVGKMKYLEKEHGSAAMTMMGSIKRAIDPSNLMNPGKLIPEKFCY
ncbi:D-lactate dehydrogenase [cytochrome], mitochondrial isoform X3 [Physcomitrium patens]|uniref:D-lactate dehydrogenase [cytochrome], mitochondrial isoform X3 n=1 Tax=Physcomitrium patens TaxID=3218 RepID=UPI003CCCC380